MQAERPSLLTSSPSLNAYAQPQGNRDRGDEEDSSSGGFEFSFDCGAGSPIPADQIFHNGRIKPLIFNVHQQAAEEHRGNMKTTSQRKALRRLFTEERREQPHSSSSFSQPLLSEPDSDSYCVWEPPPKTTANQKAGNWRSKLRDLLTRNASHNRSASFGTNVKFNPSKSKNDDDDDATRQPHLARKRATKEAGGGGGRRSSYLPYRQELVGIFGRNL